LDNDDQNVSEACEVNWIRWSSCSYGAGPRLGLWLKSSEVSDAMADEEYQHREVLVLQPFPKKNKLHIVNSNHCVIRWKVLLFSSYYSTSVCQHII
jgi:hypothetical protein